MLENSRGRKTCIVGKSSRINFNNKEVNVSYNILAICGIYNFTKQQIFPKQVIRCRVIRHEQPCNHTHPVFELGMIEHAFSQLLELTESLCIAFLDQIYNKLLSRVSYDIVSIRERCKSHPADVSYEVCLSPIRVTNVEYRHLFITCLFIVMIYNCYPN